MDNMYNIELLSGILESTLEEAEITIRPEFSILEC